MKASSAYPASPGPKASAPDPPSWRKQRIIEWAHEDIVDQVFHGLAAAAMREGDGGADHLRPKASDCGSITGSCRHLVPPHAATLIIGRRRSPPTTPSARPAAFRGAGGAEHTALPGLDDARQHFAALAGLGIGDPEVGDERTSARRRSVHKRRETARRNDRSSPGRAIRKSRATRRPAPPRLARGIAASGTTRAYWFRSPPALPRSASAASRSTAAHPSGSNPAITRGLR